MGASPVRKEARLYADNNHTQTGPAPVGFGGTWQSVRWAKWSADLRTLPLFIGPGRACYPFSAAKKTQSQLADLDMAA